MTIWMLALAIVGAVAVAPLPKYRVSMKADAHTDFAALQTYAWAPGWAAFDRLLDTHIVAAIDHELASLGLMKRMAPPADVLVTYGALRRTDVDLDAKRLPDGTYPEHPVGTLVVLMLEPDSRRELLRGRIDVPFDASTAQFEAQIDRIVAQLFAHYPKRGVSRQR